MRIIDVSEVKNIDCGDTCKQVNEELRKGWALLDIYHLKGGEGDDCPCDIIGKPRNPTE